MRRGIALALLLLTLGWAGISEASVLFFWRAETTTFDATADKNTVSPTAVATPNGSVTLDAAAAKVGSTGVLADAGGENYRMSNATNSNASPTVGSVCGWFQFSSWTTDRQFFTIVAAGNQNIYLRLNATSGSGNIRLLINVGDASVSTFTSNSANLGPSNWYFICAAWDQPNNDRRVAIWDTSGTLIDDDSDLTTSYTAPSTLAATDAIRVGEQNGAAVTYYADNIFIGSAFTDIDEFYCNRNITTFANYAPCGGSVTPRGMLMGVYP